MNGNQADGGLKAVNGSAVKKKIEILDSTLRDGAQGEGISFSVLDKIGIVKALDEFGVTYIEAGNPASNPKDAEFFEKAKELALKNAKLCAFGSTRRKHTGVGADPHLAALLGAGTPVVSIFGKSWDLHVSEILRVSPEENLAMISETVAYAKAAGKEVIFDAEHFFDGYASNPGYAVSALRAAHRAGADVLCLCDTNGGTLPRKVGEITAAVCSMFPETRVGIHCHNDSGCAVACSIEAAQSGACHVQGTFIGYGERCGNADLSAVIPNLQLKAGYGCVNGRLERLAETAKKIAGISNVALPRNLPYVGESAFAHKGGMHIDGVAKLPRSFEHVEPSEVGNTRRFLMSEVSGRTTVIAKLRGIAPQLTKESPETARIMEKLKQLEHEGYQFESADASFELVVMRELGLFKPHFSLVMYKTTGEFPAPDERYTSSAMIDISVGGKYETAASRGSGPVHALDLALRRALLVFYPELHSMRLIDYKVRVLETDHATAARVRVAIESTDGENVWATIGVSADIIQASWTALVDSFEYKLAKLEAENKNFPANKIVE